MSTTLNAKQIIEKLKAVVDADSSAADFTFSGEMNAAKNKIKSGDECINLIGSNLVVYSSESEEGQQERAEIKRLLEQVLQKSEMREERAEKVRERVLCALQSVEDMLRTLKSDLYQKLDRIAQERYKNARENLFLLLNEMWQGKRDPNYAKHVREWSYKVLEYAPDDFYACFCLKIFAEKRNLRDVHDFLSHNAEGRTQDEILFVLRTTLLFYEAGYPVEIWIAEIKGDEALKNYFEKKFREEKNHLSDELYNPAVERDVFVAYSHKDVDLAWEVVRYLEETEEWECFFAVRNLRQCDGSAFDDALKTALNHCKVFLFISTANSRDKDCYAQQEMEFIRDFDRARYEAKAEDAVVGCAYDKISRKYKMPRVEYLVGDHYGDTKRTDKETRKFFSGLSYCKDMDALGERVYGIIKEGAWLPAEPTPQKVAEAVVTTAPIVEEKKTPKKYCVTCLTECEVGVKFCPECGKKEFVFTKEEAESIKSSKYCASCLTANPASAKFCKECGNTEFADTYEEAKELKELAEQIAAEETREKQAAAWAQEAEDYFYGTNGKEQDDDKTAEFAKKAAEAGNVDGQFWLGYCYDQGIGVEQSSEQAVVWYTKAAERGHAEAQNNLGVCYENGDGIDQSWNKAVYWYKKAADQGSPDGLFNLGDCYEKGNGVVKSLEKAIELYQKAAKKGNQNAIDRLESIAEEKRRAEDAARKQKEEETRKQQEAVARKREEEARKRKEEEAQRQREEAARKQREEDARRQKEEALRQKEEVARKQREKEVLLEQAEEWSRIADEYYFGIRGKEKDLVKAVFLYKKAAEDGYAHAQFNLGYCYECGEGVTKSLEKAVEWYTKAANQGLDRAQFNLGLCYQYGKGVAVSIPKAIEWYEKAAAQGHEGAQKVLKKLKEEQISPSELKKNSATWSSAGDDYYWGRNGTSRDLAKAAKCYSEGAEEGEDAAQYSLACCYRYGYGVPRSDEKAATWFLMAAERNNKNAQLELAFCYQLGKGTYRSHKEAKKWFAKLEKSRLDRAKIHINTFSKPGINFALNVFRLYPNDPGIQFYMGLCYEFGLGYKQSYAKAVECFRKGALQGDFSAQFELGYCYEMGLGVAKSIESAIVWYKKAAAQEDFEAEGRLQALGVYSY